MGNLDYKAKVSGVFSNFGMTSGRIWDGFHVAAASAPTFGGAIALHKRCSSFPTLQLVCGESGSMSFDMHSHNTYE
jgi:hypothetical protein